MDAVQTSVSTADNLIQLFPNPASSWVYVKSILNNPAKQVQVYDAAGRLVTLLSGQSPTLDVSDLSAGFYSLRIIRDGDVEVAHLAVK
jgi:Secretion system C-terminal sorting domain